MEYNEYKHNLDLLTGEINEYADRLCATYGAYKEIDITQLDVLDGIAEFRILIREEEWPPQGTEFTMLTVFGSAKVMGDGVIIYVDPQGALFAQMRVGEDNLFYLVRKIAS